MTTNICKNCQNTLQKPNSIFCSRSCAAKFNNLHRSAESRLKQQQTIRKTYNTQIFKHTCVECNNVFEVKDRNNRTFCSSACQSLHKRKDTELRILNGTCKNNLALKRYIIDQSGYFCSECNLSEWRDKPITLELDHIDGDPSHNQLCNLRLLCPNCHSQTPTFRFKSRTHSEVKQDSRSTYHREYKKSKR